MIDACSLVCVPRSGVQNEPFGTSFTMYTSSTIKDYIPCILMRLPDRALEIDNESGRGLWMDCGEIVRSWFGSILQFFCTRKCHGIHGGVRCYSGLDLPRYCNGSHLKEALQDGGEVPSCSLLVAG